MWLGADAPESAMRFYPLAVISHGAIGASVLVSELPDKTKLSKTDIKIKKPSRSRMKISTTGDFL